jgi:radical SAM protein with 4Fe4S-binding SPASM domain
MCYNPLRDRIYDIAIIDRIVQSVANSRIPHAYLIGGEPTMIPEEKLNEYIEILSPYSSVTIVTNGQIRLEHISPKLACFGIPIHGSNALTHEFHTRVPGSFVKALSTMRFYVEQGFDVRCIPVLTGYNFDQMYEIIRIAAEYGVESIFVDRYENGGIGAQATLEFSRLKPTIEQFKIALGQMIQARKDFPSFGGRVGFGTAIPYCLDDRLVGEGMTSSCGVGTSFGAINPDGDFRICNQSPIVYGNVLSGSIETIWNSPGIEEFRRLGWVNEPCRSCGALLDCAGGCKVDTGCSNTFCIDYAVRCNTLPLSPELVKRMNAPATKITYSKKYRHFTWDPFAKLNNFHRELFLVTRYQTILIDDPTLSLLQAIQKQQTWYEQTFVNQFKETFTTQELRKLISKLVLVGAIRIIEEVCDGKNT